MNCPNCGNVVQEDAVFCDQCGVRLGGVAEAPAPAREPLSAPAVQPTPGEILCSGCGAENLPGEMFCSECGTPLAAPAPVHAPPVEAPAPAAIEIILEEPAVDQASETAAAPKPEQQVPCAACGAEARPDDVFCFACGANLSDQRVAPAQAAPQPARETVVVGPGAPARAPDECHSCGAKVQRDDLFCDFCGAALAGAAVAQATPAAAPQASARPASGAAASAAVVGGEQPLLVVAASGIEILLPQGAEALIGREDPYSGVFPDVDLTPHGGEEAGVSRRHCKLTLAEGAYAILDLGSTNYTWVNQQRLDPATPAALKSGDEIRVGRLKLVFRTRT